jgi:hypothetical protein
LQTVIGVFAKPGQQAVVEEFFELFKTPWEFYTCGHRYDVVLTTAPEVPDSDTKLLLVFGSEPRPDDERGGLTRKHLGGSLRHRNTIVPIYQALLINADGESVLGADLLGSGHAAIHAGSTAKRTIRLGYDLFDEVQFLLSTGQPVEHASIPTLDIHIGILRDLIVGAGIPLVEILPTPAGHSFSICLTHDIDFVGIRRHCLDHSMWGFLYRATVGAARNFWTGRLSVRRLLGSLHAAASLPLVYLGWANDFWLPFEWYLRIEKGLPATYFLIPFKKRSGEKVAVRGAKRRATAYDVSDIPEWVSALRQHGCEVAVHGIDAWHSVDMGRQELARIAATDRERWVGVRIHWLLNDANTSAVLDRAGYAYDSTIGYNETVGYRAGTSCVFRPIGVDQLFELPLHIQDGALFYPHQLDLSEADAWNLCEQMIANAQKFGGVLTVLWHDRSHAPERFWGDFYIRLLERLRMSTGWFGTASQVVEWFRKRRGVRFERCADAECDQGRLCYHGEEIQPPLTIRLHQTPSDSVDIPWNGSSPLDLNRSLAERQAERWTTPETAALSLS